MLTAICAAKPVGFQHLTFIPVLVVAALIKTLPIPFLPIMVRGQL